MAHWIDGRLVDGEPGPDSPPDSPWSRLLAVLLLLLVFDFALGRIPEEGERRENGQATAPGMWRTLSAAAEDAEAGRRSIVLIGDSVLAGDAQAGRVEGWREQRVIDHMRAGLSPESDAAFHQVALHGLLPVDAFHLVSELDRLDPAGEVEVVFELNLRYFSRRHAEQLECSHEEICVLGDTLDLVGAGEASAAATSLEHARRNLVEAGGAVHGWLRARIPVHRRRPRVEAGRLDELEGLVVERIREGEERGRARLAHDRREARGHAQVGEEYRSASTSPGAAGRELDVQLAALSALLDRAEARGRRLTMFVTPLEDDFARDTLEGSPGRHYAELARLINDRESERLALIDLDHPLFVGDHFVDHVHLRPEGNRLLAINLLHELNLRLAERPYEWMMVHPEGFDRSLVHRVDRGYAEGGAWQALFDRAEGVTVTPDGSRIVVADTHNHVLRELRGNLQFVERLAGEPGEPGRHDGDALADARLSHPRFPAILGESVWFIDGARRSKLRVVEHGTVRSPEWSGPGCTSYRRLRARHGALWILCEDSRLLRLDPERGEVQVMSTGRELVSFDLGPDAVYLADARGRVFSRVLGQDGRLGRWQVVFPNTGQELLMTGHRIAYPYHFNDVRLARIVDLHYVDRYGGLLIADEFPIESDSARLRRELTERIHLRYLDLEAQRVLPWIKALAHGEAYLLYNEAVDQLVSYWHIGSMAIAQDDASLIWLERERSRLFRLADGLLGVAKSGNHHTKAVTVPQLMTIARRVAGNVETQMRPDRYFDTRWEPLPREGPYVALLLGSSMSSMSDRFSNYSLGRRLELELQRELGYRDHIRLDLFQVSRGAATFKDNVDRFDTWMSASVPPDVLLLEAHDFGGGSLHDLEGKAEINARFAELERLAERYDTLVVFYDLSSLESNRRDGMRSTDRDVRELLGQARQLGFTVIDPGDALLAELLDNSPWGNQPFDDNQHHGSYWGVNLTARMVAAMAYPKIRQFLRGRVPARRREVPASVFERREANLEPLRLALDEVEIDRDALPEIEPTYLQREYADRELRIYVDLAGFPEEVDRRDLDLLAVSAIVTSMQDDVYADLAEHLRVELVEFRNYDEYGSGVLASANSRWKREFDRQGLEDFLRKHRPG